MVLGTVRERGSCGNTGRRLATSTTGQAARTHLTIGLRGWATSRWTAPGRLPAARTRRRAAASHGAADGPDFRTRLPRPRTRRGAWPDEEPLARATLPRGPGPRALRADWMLPATLGAARKRALGLIADWPWLAPADLGALLGVSARQVSQLLQPLREASLVDRVAGRLVLSDRGLALLARRDRSAANLALRRWSARPLDPHAPLTWRNIASPLLLHSRPVGCLRAPCCQRSPAPVACAAPSGWRTADGGPFVRKDQASRVACGGGHAAARDVEPVCAVRAAGPLTVLVLADRCVAEILPT